MNIHLEFFRVEVKMVFCSNSLFDCRHNCVLSVVGTSAQHQRAQVNAHSLRCFRWKFLTTCQLAVVLHAFHGNLSSFVWTDRRTIGHSIRYQLPHWPLCSFLSMHFKMFCHFGETNCCRVLSQRRTVNNNKPNIDSRVKWFSSATYATNAVSITPYHVIVLVLLSPSNKDQLYTATQTHTPRLSSAHNSFISAVSRKFICLQTCVPFHIAFRFRKVIFNLHASLLPQLETTGRPINWINRLWVGKGTRTTKNLFIASRVARIESKFITSRTQIQFIFGCAGNVQLTSLT